MPPTSNTVQGANDAVAEEGHLHKEPNDVVAVAGEASSLDPPLRPPDPASAAAGTSYARPAAAPTAHSSSAAEAGPPRPQAPADA